jgi:hypothetical protein
VRPAPANNKHEASEGGRGESYGIDFLLDLVTSSLMRGIQMGEICKLRWLMGFVGHAIWADSFFCRVGGGAPPGGRGPARPKFMVSLVDLVTSSLMRGIQIGERSKLGWLMGFVEHAKTLA